MSESFTLRVTESQAVKLSVDKNLGGGYHYV